MRRDDKILSTPTADELQRRDEDRELELALIARTGHAVDGGELEVWNAEGTKALEPLEDSPALNRLLLKHARKSFNEISIITGIPVGEVAERLTTLLDNRSWRDDLQEEKLLLAEIGMVMDDIRERMSRLNTEDEGFASMARVQLAAIKLSLDQLKERRAAVDGKLALVTAKEAEFMAAAIRLATEKAIFRLEKRYKELDTEVVYEIWEESLEEAVEFLEVNSDER